VGGTRSTWLAGRHGTTVTTPHLNPQLLRAGWHLVLRATHWPLAEAYDIQPDPTLARVQPPGSRSPYPALSSAAGLVERPRSAPSSELGPGPAIWCASVFGPRPPASRCDGSVSRKLRGVSWTDVPLGMGPDTGAATPESRSRSALRRWLVSLLSISEQLNRMAVAEPVRAAAHQPRGPRWTMPQSLLYSTPLSSDSARHL